MPAIFGPAGCSLQYMELGYKGSLDIPKITKLVGLDAFEYQCGRGVNIGEEKARALGKLALEEGIKLSLHAPLKRRKDLTL